MFLTKRGCNLTGFNIDEGKGRELSIRAAHGVEGEGGCSGGDLAVHNDTWIGIPDGMLSYVQRGSKVYQVSSNVGHGWRRPSSQSGKSLAGAF